MSIIIHVFTYITKVETIKRQTGTRCGCMAAQVKARYRGLELRPRLYAGSVATAPLRRHKQMNIVFI